MADIVFLAYFGNETKVVELTEGTYGPTGWIITIDGKNCGEIFKRPAGYTYHDDYFTMDDIQAFVDRIVAFTGELEQMAVFYRFGTYREILGYRK